METKIVRLNTIRLFSFCICKRKFYQIRPTNIGNLQNRLSVKSNNHSEFHRWFSTSPGRLQSREWRTFSTSATLIHAKMALRRYSYFYVFKKVFSFPCNHISRKNGYGEFLFAQAFQWVYIRHTFPFREKKLRQVATKELKKNLSFHCPKLRIIENQFTKVTKLY